MQSSSPNPKRYQYDIFISHSSSDREILEQISDRLKKYPLKICILPQKQTAGDFIHEIEAALVESRVLLVLASPASFASFYVLKEINSFQVLMAKDANRQIIPVILPGLGEDQIPLFLRTVQYIDLRSSNLSDKVSLNQKVQEIIDLFHTIGPESRQIPDRLQVSDLYLKLINDKVREIKDLIAEGQYFEAARCGKEYLESLGSEVNESIKFKLRVNELKVRFAHATMYLGEPNKALEILLEVVGTLENYDQALIDQEFETWHMVLGLAENHIGYINWMDYVHYDDAIHYFSKAIHCFQEGDLKVELATSLDNLGRVCAELGFHLQAELLINRARKIREELGDKYRLSLSLDSMANAYLASGQSNRALLFSQEAQQLFKQFQNEHGGSGWERGIGLSLLTCSRALRQVGSYAYSRGIHKRGGFRNEFTRLAEAERNLQAAEQIFKEKGEKIRLHQVYKEWACVYREKAKLYMEMKQKDEGMREADNADEKFDICLRYIPNLPLERNLNHDVKMIDTLQERARLWHTVENRRRAFSLLEKVDAEIPEIYKFRKDQSISPLAPEECVEEFWRQAGKLHYLRAELWSETRWQVALEEFVLGIAYFCLFKQRSVVQADFLDNASTQAKLTLQTEMIESLGDFLEQLSNKQLDQARSSLLRELIEVYQLDPAWLIEVRELISLRSLEKA